MQASRSNRPAGLLAVLALGLAATGCGGAAHEATPFRPAIRSFIANPGSIPSGGTTVLRWNVSGATTVSISPGVGEVTGVAVAVSPATTTTYVLTATNEAGSSTSQTTVTVAVAPPAGLTYAVNPASYTVGTAITPNAPSSTGGAIAGYTVSPSLPAGLSLDATTGVLSGTPTAVTAAANYTVTGTNVSGSTTASLRITVAPPSPPTIVSFGASPSAIAAGESSVLSWDVLGATLLAIDNGVGPVTGTSTTVRPASTTTYRLTATNAGGSVFATVTVSVGTGAPTNLRYANATYVVGVAITPNTPTSSGGAILAYAVAPPLPDGLALDTTTGVISGTPTTVTPSATYVVTGTNASGSTTASVVLAVNAAPAPGKPVIRAFAANPSTIPIGSPTIFSWDVLDADTVAIEPYIGVVTGTELEFSPSETTTFTLTATNTNGSTSADVLVTVVYPAPTNLAYAVNPATYTVGAAITPNTPTHDGGPVLSYAVLPPLPTGLSLDTTTGVISGTPTAATPTATYLVTGTNPGGSSTAALVLTVQLPTFAITRQPTDASALPPATATFSVAATGLAPLTYRWRKNGTDISGATSATYTTPALTLADDGAVFDVVVGDAASRTATSVGALLTLRGFFATGSMAAARAGHTATLLATGKVLVTGGTDGTGAVRTAELYDPSTGAFTATGSMTVAREGHVAVLLASGKVLVAGGCTSNATGCVTYLASAELYDPSTGAFTATGSMATRRTDFAPARVGEKVLVAGGFWYDAATTTEHFLATAELYDPAAGTFSATSTMHAARRYPMSAVQPDGTVVVTGGLGATGALATTEIFDALSKVWVSVGPLATARQLGTATALLGGDVLVAGGLGATFLQGAERYSSSTAAFAATGSMATARTLQTATLLEATGEVLVAGGAGGGATAEVYDPVAGSFGPAPSMSTPRARQTATLLPDGRVLVAGGAGNAGMLRTAELWAPAQ